MSLLRRLQQAWAKPCPARFVCKIHRNMPLPSVALYFFQAADVHRVESPEVSFDGVLIDFVSENGELFLRKILDALAF